MTTPSERGDQLAAQVGTDALKRTTAEAPADPELASDEATTIPAPPPAPSEPPVSQLFDAIADTLPPTKREGSGEHRVQVAYLGERALAWCLEEARVRGDKRIPVERVCQYLQLCERDGKNIGVGLAKQHRATGDVSFCAAGRGFAEYSVRLAYDSMPPHRAGALEIRDDAQEGRRPGEEWLSVEDCLRLRRWPPPGSIAIYRNVASSWKGHAETIIVASAEGFRSVGFNEHGGKIFVDVKLIDYRDAARADGTQRLVLLGFVVPVEVRS